MLNLFNLFILIVLGLLSLIDIKYKEIPSIFLTGLLFIALFFRFESLQFGLLAFVLAYLLYEGSFISGIADIKLIALVGLMINSFFYFGIFIILLMVLGISIKFYARFKFKRDLEFAFIPIIFLCYFILLIIGGIV